jgi:hypothetical protein
VSSRDAPSRSATATVTVTSCHACRPLSPNSASSVSTTRSDASAAAPSSAARGANGAGASSNWPTTRLGAGGAGDGVSGPAVKMPLPLDEKPAEGACISVEALLPRSSLSATSSSALPV